MKALAGDCGLAFDERQFEKMLFFVNLLIDWNRSFNLISRSDEAKIVSRHIAESLGMLIVTAPPASCRIMDIGSGGGFPAVPMKIIRPDLQFTLVESNGKKARFLRNVVMKLALENLSVFEGRVEYLMPEERHGYSLMTARAVTGLPQLWKWSSAHLIPGGKLMAIKGGDISNEIAALSGLDDLREIATLKFPDRLNIEKSRVVISLSRK
jgi:16S rRNA (guanine527-N7)-methyltransferase